MCVAVSGELIEKNNTSGMVNVRGNIIPVELGIVNAEVGDFVLVHAGCAISVLSKDENDELSELMDMLENADEED